MSGALQMSLQYSMTMPCFEDIFFERNHLCHQPTGDFLTATSGLSKKRGLGGPTWSLTKISPDSTYAKSFIKLPLDEADEGSL